MRQISCQGVRFLKAEEDTCAKSGSQEQGLDTADLEAALQTHKIRDLTCVLTRRLRCLS